ncbi:Aldo-keto reductase [Candidatus Rhodobacter oscarellae]|uniref:Aldo-keto reductase n=1 Tax=Candidatus Rhodobacter oscarellae TaxID=1675527 RepID=A0A0J9DZF7_9RHOB|nr:aldo/keto reductase [Candidatus Rhodobacter lobularis]KMW56071.1 Aldo-keto reductase [Candidatus Rhodobacter lobularis]
MEHRALGQGGPKVHPIGYGAMSFSDFYGPTTEAASHAILDMCRDVGVTHLDTANVYGMGASESAIGSYFAANPAAKTEFTIATKAAITRDPETNRRYFDNSPAHFEAELDRSLQRLGLECVDLFYAHRRDADMPMAEIAGNLARLVEKGKAKSIGLSEVAPNALRQAHAEHPIAAVQSEYSLSVRSPELGLIQTCAELGTAVVAFSPVGRSLLTDAPLPLDQVQTLGFLATNPRFIEPNYSANIAATDAFRALAAKMGVPAAGLAIAWVLAQGPHVIAIPGTRSTQHFAEIMAAAEITLGADDLAQIEAVLPVGWAHGDRYSAAQWIGPERYC